MYSPSLERLGSTRTPTRGLAVRPILVLLATAGLLALPAGAQESREREALRRAQQQLYKVQQDNAVLQREKLELQKKLGESDDALKAIREEVGRLRRASKALQAAERVKEELRVQLSQAQEQSAQAVQTHQAQVSGLRREIDGLQLALETARLEDSQALARLRRELKDETNRASACEEKNTQLYSVTVNLIDRYRENRGVWEKFLLSEPFTGLKAVQVENLLDDMRSKAGENKIEPSAAAQPAVRDH